MTITSWSKNSATGKYEGWGYDDLGNLCKFEEYEQLALPLPEPEKPPIFLENCDPGDEDAQ